MVDINPLHHMPKGTARVVLADPPWNFRTYSPKGWQKSAHAHYPCMDLADIKALSVAALCADDAVLVLWGTQAQFHLTYEVSDAWGFIPKTMGTWAKQTSTGNNWQFGTGFILRSAAEFFLIGTRGKPVQLVKDRRNLIVAPVRQHSQKPDEMYDLIERMWHGPYVELFATRTRPGWHSWTRPWAGNT